MKGGKACTERRLSTKGRKGSKRWRRTAAKRTERTNAKGVMNLRTSSGWENSCLCLFDEGRRGRYLSGYICARFEVEALNQGPACFGWRLTNEPMTTSPAWLRSLALSLSLFLSYVFSPLPSCPLHSFPYVLSRSRENKTIIYSSARESTDGIRTDRADTIYAVSRSTWWKDDRDWRRRNKTEEDGVGLWLWLMVAERAGGSLLHVTEN